MIRIGLPAPTLLRFRLRAQLAANRMQRRAQKLRKEVWASVYSDVTALQRLPFRLFRKPITLRQPEVEPMMLLEQFEDRYQSLIDLLCWSAKDGDHTDRDARYAELRSWFVQNYEPVRPLLIRFLDDENEEDAAVACGETTRPRDAFESLFLPVNVDAIIHSETVIARICQTRCALETCRSRVDGEKQ